MHKSAFIIKLMDVLIIYIIRTYLCTCGFVFKMYTSLSTFLCVYNSSLHNLIIHYTNLYCCCTTKVKYGDRTIIGYIRNTLYEGTA